MKVIFVGSEKASSGVGVIPVFKGGKFYGAAKRYARDSVGQVKAAMKAGHFDGAQGTSASLYAPTGSKLAGLLLKGAGEKADFDAEMPGELSVSARDDVLLVVGAWRERLWWSWARTKVRPQTHSERTQPHAYARA